MKFEGPLALSLSGGGSKGAYIVGVLKYLVETNNLPDVRIIYGTSTGALISCCMGAYIATKEQKYFDKLVEIYQTVTDKDIITANHDVAYWFFGKKGTLAAAMMFGGKSIYDTKPLEKIIAENMTDELWYDLIEAAKRKENPVEIGFCTFNLQKAKSELFTTLTHPHPDILRKAVLASANQPVFMPPVQIFPNEKTQYVDGGVNNYNPAEKLFESKLFKDVKQILTISTDPRIIEEDPTSFKSISEILERTLRVLILGVFDTDLKTAQLYNVLLKLKNYLTIEEWEKFLSTEISADLKQFIQEHLELKKAVSITNIYPKKSILMDPLKFDPEKMKQVMTQGQRDAKAFCEE